MLVLLLLRRRRRRAACGCCCCCCVCVCVCVCVGITHVNTFCTCHNAFLIVRAAWQVPIRDVYYHTGEACVQCVCVWCFAALH